MRAALLSALFLLPGMALADPHITWGAPVMSRGTGPCEATLAMADPARGEMATVEVYNGLVTGLGHYEIALELEGFAVTLSYTAGNGELPDVAVVTPPAGYMAEPAELVLQEGQRDTITIRPIPLS